MRIPDRTLSPKLNIETTNAKLIMKTTRPSLDVEISKNGLEIENRPIKLKIDNGAFFDSIGLKSIETFTREYVQAGKAAALNSAARCSREAQYLSDGAALGDLAYMRIEKSIDSMLIFIPEEKPEISWEYGYVNISYKPDEITNHWDTGGVEVQYIPYSVDISVKD